MAAVTPSTCREHICYYCGDGAIMAPICHSCGRDFRCSECGPAGPTVVRAAASEREMTAQRAFPDRPGAEHGCISTSDGTGQQTSEVVAGDILVHLGRLALGGQHHDIAMYIRRQAHRLRNRCPQTAHALDELVQHLPPPSPLRDGTTSPLPAADHGGSGRQFKEKTLMPEAGTEYRIEFSVQRRRVEDDDFVEIGFGSSGSWDDLGVCSHMVNTIVQGREWQTTGTMPAPGDI